MRARLASCELWHQRLNRLAGVVATIIPDPTDNPLDRLLVRIDPAEAGATAWALTSALAAADPPIIVRDHEVEHGLFYLDPCNLHDGEAEIVAAADRADAGGDPRQAGADAGGAARPQSRADAGLA